MSTILKMPDAFMHHSKYTAGTPEYWADVTTAKMIKVADTAPPVIREQTIEFKDTVLALIFQGMKRALADEVLACAKLLDENGQSAAAQIVLSRFRPATP